MRYKFTILRKKVTIMRLKLAILTLFLKIGSISQNYNLKSHFFLQIVLAVLTISQNCEFISCHSYFVTRDCKLISFPFTFVHLADAFIQSDLQCIHVIHFHQYVCSLGIEPTTFGTAEAMLYHWAIQEHLSHNYKKSVRIARKNSQLTILFYLCQWWKQAFIIYCKNSLYSSVDSFYEDL